MKIKKIKVMRKYRSIFPWRKYMAKCGHETKLKGKIEAYGKSTIMKINAESVPYCLDCLEKMTIRCPWCGGPIFIGEYITLYTPAHPDFNIVEGCVIYSKDPLQIVGCQYCIQSAADYCGIWTPPGEVKRIESALEECIRTGSLVIKNF